MRSRPSFQTNIWEVVYATKAALEQIVLLGVAAHSQCLGMRVAHRAGLRQLCRDQSGARFAFVDH